MKAMNCRLAVPIGLALLTLALGAKRAQPVIISGQFKNGPSADPDYFPIGVWFQNPTNATVYKQAGFNVYVGLFNGPTEDQLRQLRDAGMQVICAQNNVALAHRDDPTIIGWMQQPDEPDNAKMGAGKSGSFVPPDQMVAQYNALRAADPTRPVFVNLSQGVANDDWVGHGNGFSDTLYPQYTQSADSLMYDVYPVADLGKAGGGFVENGADYLWYIAKGAQRLRAWSGGHKPVWDHVECTHIHNPNAKATPQQVRSEVWIALVHGARGLVYFVHDFVPQLNEHALLNDPQMLQAVTSINAEIHQLAPVLNTSALRGVAAVESSDPLVPIDISVHRHGGATYLFAVAMRNKPVSATFTIAGAPDGQPEVLGEGRHVTMTHGQVKDDFGPYGVHLYRFGQDVSRER